MKPNALEARGRPHASGLAKLLLEVVSFQGEAEEGTDGEMSVSPLSISWQQACRKGQVLNTFYDTSHLMLSTGLSGMMPILRKPRSGGNPRTHPTARELDQCSPQDNQGTVSSLTGHQYNSRERGICVFMDFLWPGTRGKH